MFSVQIQIQSSSACGCSCKVYTLALGHLFVGQFSSNVFRLAYELAVAAGRVADDACRVADDARSLDVLWHGSP